MKKLAFTISFILSISLITPIAHASGAEPGKRCKKIGQIAKEVDDDYPVGTTLVCTKKGKRKVWKISGANPSQSPTPSASPSATQSPALKSYTMAEVAQRNSASNCWTAINNKVYDLTNWISRHPGGSGTIIRLCGIDGTNQFRGQHGTAGRPSNELSGYLIGNLK